MKDLWVKKPSFSLRIKQKPLNQSWKRDAIVGVPWWRVGIAGEEEEEEDVVELKDEGRTKNEKRKEKKRKLINKRKKC